MRFWSRTAVNIGVPLALHLTQRITSEWEWDMSDPFEPAVVPPIADVPPIIPSAAGLEPPFIEDVPPIIPPTLGLEPPTSPVPFRSCPVIYRGPHSPARVLSFT